MFLHTDSTDAAALRNTIIRMLGRKGWDYAFQLRAAHGETPDLAAVVGMASTFGVQLVRTGR